MRGILTVGIMTVTVVWAFAISTAIAQVPPRTASPSVESIVGLPLSAPEVQAFLGGVRAAPPDHIPSLDGEYYRDYKLSGISLLCSREDRIITVFVYPGDRDGYARFRYPLPRGLTFEDDRGSTTRKLGLPDCAGGGDKGVLGTVDIWDTWSTDWGTLHVTYKPDGKIGLVTVMVPSRDPGCRTRK